MIKMKFFALLLFSLIFHASSSFAVGEEDEPIEYDPGISALSHIYRPSHKGYSNPAESKIKLNIGRSEFEDIREVSNYILSQYPKNQYFYVGIGRSPTPILAYLQLESGVKAQNVPLSEFRYGVEIDSDITRMTGIKSVPPLSPFKEQQLYKHFDHFFLSDQDIRHRGKVLVVDYTTSGQSLAASKRYFEKYFMVKGWELLVNTLAITYEGNTSLKKTFPDTDSIVPRNGHLLFMLARRLYKDQSEFEGFDIESKSSYVACKRPQYQNFVDEMRVAKEAYSQGDLSDDFVNAIKEFENSDNRVKFSFEIAEYEEIRKKMVLGVINDSEAIRLVKDLYARIAVSRSLIAP